MTEPTEQASVLSAAERPAAGLRGFLAAFLAAFLAVAFDPYRPERHYMRGPGPACARAAARLADSASR